MFKMPRKPHRLLGAKIYRKDLSMKGACKDGLDKVFGKRAFIVITRNRVRTLAKKREESWTYPSYVLPKDEWEGLEQYIEKQQNAKCPVFKNDSADCTCEKIAWEIIERYFCGPEVKHEK